MDHSKPYSNIVSIVQSSGSGKSRMIDNMAKLVFTIPFNICAPESQYFTFPPPDDQIYYLLNRPNVESVDAAYYLVFLRHVFEEVRNILVKLFSKPLSNYAMLAESWRLYLETDGARKSLYDSVVKGCEGSWSNILSIKNTAPVTETIQAFDQLSAAIDNCIDPSQHLGEKIKVVMYFDECQSLSTVPAPRNNDDRKLLDVLFMAISSLTSVPFIAIALSANCNALALTPSGPYSRSARAFDYGDTEFPAPITETPFDCSPRFPLRSNTLGLQDTCTVEFLARFGRPLFWAIIESVGDRKNEVLSGLINLARSKLLCKKDINVSHQDAGRHAATAVVDLRLMFNYEPLRESTRLFQAQLVANHMRTMFSIPQTRGYFISGYPSEPLLAEAAAQQMRIFRSHDPDYITDILMENLKSGFLDTEERGELVARALLTSAYDRAIEQEFQGHGDPLYSRGVSVITFIKELFVPRLAEHILESVPNNTEVRTTFRDAFKDAKVRFTHFGRMADESGTTSDAAWIALIRGMAMIPSKETGDINLIIPILLKDTTICEEVVTGMLISVKTQKMKGPVEQYEVDEEAIKFFPPSASDKARQRPYIGIVMGFGTQPSNVNTSETTKDTGKEAALPGSDQRQQTASNVDSEVWTQDEVEHTHPRYSFFVYEFLDTVCKGITPEQQETYQLLLTDFLAEHPRDDEKTRH